MLRRTVNKTILALMLCQGAWVTTARAEKLEKSKVKLVIGGSSSQIYFLALTVARQRGYFKDAGLDLAMVDAGSGAKAAQSLVGGSADVAAGAYEHTILLQARGVSLESIVLFGRFPGNVVAINTKRLAEYPTVKDLKGAKIGISAPGSATDIFLGLVLAKAGVSRKDISVIAVGNASGAVAAIRQGEIDAICTLDPVIAELVSTNDIKIVADSRTEEGTVSYYGGHYASGALYTTHDFVAKNPRTAQALATAVVRALQWMKTASIDEIIATVPASYMTGHPDIYRKSIESNLGNFQHDGIITAEAAATVLRVEQQSHAAVRDSKIDISKTYTNTFVQNALAELGVKSAEGEK